MRRLHIVLAVILMMSLLPLSAWAGDGPVPGASHPYDVQGGENRIDLQSILHITTTSTDQSIERALSELGYTYDYFYGDNWTGIDFGPYDIVIIGMDGGDPGDASVAKIRTDVIDAGKRVIWIGGSALQSFVTPVNNYLVPNETNNYYWTVSGSPQFTVVQPGHALAAGLPPDPFDWANNYAGYYQLRATDATLDVIAVNGDGYDDYFLKDDNWPVVGEGAPDSGGELIWFLNSPHDQYWQQQSDFDVLKQIIANAIAYSAVQEPDIEVTPESLYAEQYPDEVTQQMLQICNVGGADLTWSLTEVPGLLGRGQLPDRSAGANSDDAGAFQAVASGNRIAGGPVLIIQDQDPWGLTSIKDILTANGIGYDLVDSSQIPTIDLDAYGLVIIPSNQTSAFYTTWNANIAKFEAYVESGKALWMSTCAFTSTTPEPLVPGGVINANDMDQYNVVLEPDHPWVQGVGSPFYGNYASHDSFTNLYPGTIEVCEAQTSGNATLLDYMMGSGRILATGQTLEWLWASGYEGGLILENSLLDMYAWGPGDDVPWLSEDPTSGTVPPGECQDVTVTFDSTGMAPGDYFADLLVDSNDPDEPQVTVPVQLTVLEWVENTMHVQAIDGRFEEPFLVMKVQVVDQDSMPLCLVEVDATLTMPFGEWMRMRLSKPTGWARFWAPLLTNGNYMICVDNLTLAGYTYNPDDNVVTCMDWDW